MPILLIFLAYLTVKYKLFHTRLITAQVLVFGIFALTFAQYFFLNNRVSFILNTVTFVGMIILGDILIKNVKKEIELRKQIEKQLNELKQMIQINPHFK